MRKRTPAIILLTTLALAGLSGCTYLGGDSSTDEVNPSAVAARTIHTDDGREIQCVFYMQEAVTCDWTSDPQ